MPQIVLSHEQAKIFSNATEAVTFCDPDGNELCTVEPKPWFTEEEIAEAKRDAENRGPGITTWQLLDRLRKLAPE